MNLSPSFRLCEKSSVRLTGRTFFLISSTRRPIMLATSVGRRTFRKRFYAIKAYTTFHTACIARSPCDEAIQSSFFRITGDDGVPASIRAALFG